jgi:flagellar hook assembly protein FlgD
VVTEDVYEADIVLSPTSVDNETALPTVTALAQNYPNPFNATTNISFSLANAGEVELSVYDLLGRKVSTLVASNLPAGSHVINWNGLDDSGHQVSSGMYLYVLKTAGETFANRMVLLK